MRDWKRHRFPQWLLCLAAAGLVLAACTTTRPRFESYAEPAPTVAPANPFASPSTLPYEVPPFDRITNADYAPAFDAGMAEHRKEIEAIASRSAAPTFDNTIVAMERSGQILNRVATVFFSLASTHTSPEIQALQADYAPKLSAHQDAIYLDAALYGRVKTLYGRRAELGLEPEALRLIERYHTDFVRAGARLSDADKERLKAINAELSTLTTQFGTQVLKEVNAQAILIGDVARLKGLPEESIAAAAEAAKAAGHEGQWLITLQNTTGQPPLAALDERALREQIFQASIVRGTHGDDFDNRAVVAKIVALRATRAALLGYEHHAAYVLEDETAKTPAAVNAMLARLAPAAVANARREAADMQKLIDAEGGGFDLAAWDWDYYAEKVRKARYDLDEAATRPYFELDHVLLDGAFFMASRLYGLSFRPRADLPVYHPDVRVFEVFEADGSPLGLFYFDPFARPSKRGGAWMNSLVSQSRLMGTKPVVTNNLNIPKPPDGQPVLLTFDQANTLFHEFGHALHGLFSNVTYPAFSGTSVPRDFVEYPSQVHEMWTLWPEVLAHYARHYQTGEPMPQVLVDKILAAEKFNQGFATTEYLAAALLDQSWHQLPPEQAKVSDVLAFENQALTTAGVKLDTVYPRYRSAYFSHIFAGGYSAGYYAYIWSEVLDAESVGWFKDNGGLKRENGDWFRAQLLSKGGSVDAMTLFRNFRGRDPSIEPLLERRGLRPADQPTDG